MVQVRSILGVAGVDSKESDLAKGTSFITQTIMLFIVVWLLVSDYIQIKYQFSLHLISVIHWIIWVFFVAETVIMMLLVKRKWHYLITNWLNIVIIFLVFPSFWGHYDNSSLGILRIIRVAAIFYKMIPFNFFSDKEFTVKNFFFVLSMFFVVTVFAGLILSYFDNNFSNPWQGIWWAFQTVTTVGYGDAVPGTFAGQIFAVAFMLVGVGLLGVLSASFTYFLVRRKTVETEKEMQKEMYKKIDEMQKSIEAFQKHIQADKDNRDKQ